MSCNRDLIGFHFGELAAAERLEVEAHLAGCRACLGEYFAFKRGIEAGDDAPRPSEAARVRLRRAVAQRLGVAPVSRRWWERPMALGVAAAVMVAAMAVTEQLTSGPGEKPLALTDRP